MMPAVNHIHMKAVGWVVLVGHALILVLGLFDRATYQNVNHTALRELSDASSWNIVHILVITLLVGTKKSRYLSRAYTTSFGAFIAWGTINLAVGLETNRPISLLGPLAVLVVLSPLSIICANYWIYRWDEERVVRDVGTPQS